LYLFSGDSSCDPLDQQLHEPSILHPLLAHELCEPMAVEVDPTTGHVPQLIGRISPQQEEWTVDSGWNKMKQGIQTHDSSTGMDNVQNRMVKDKFYSP